MSGKQKGTHVCLSSALMIAALTIGAPMPAFGVLVGTPQVNTGILLIGAILASWMGTTGISCDSLSPLLEGGQNAFLQESR